jgi:hypothetical protein
MTGNFAPTTNFHAADFKTEPKLVFDGHLRKCIKRRNLTVVNVNRSEIKK